MAFCKTLMIGALAAAVTSTSAFAATSGLRPSDTGLATRRAGVSLGSASRAAPRHKDQSDIASGTLLFGALAGAAVVAGVIEVTDNGGSH